MEAIDKELIYDDLPGAVPPEEVRELYIPQEVKETQRDEAEFGELFAAHRDDVHVVNNIIRSKMEDRSYDQDFMDSFTPERVEQDLAVNEITGVDLSFFEGITNENDYHTKMGRAKEIQHLNQMIEDTGGLKNFAAAISAYATDPVGFAIDAAAGGSSKAGMLARFLESGGRAAAADLITEALRTTDGEPIELTDLALGTLTAFGTGGLFGIPGSKAAKLEAEEAAAIKPLVDDLKKSAGAAENPDFPSKGIGETSSDRITVAEEVGDKIGAEGIPDRKFSKAQISHAARAQDSQSAVVRKASADVHGVGVEPSGKVREIPMEMDSARLKEQNITPWYQAVNENYASWLKETKGKGFLRRQGSHEDFEAFMEMVGDFRHGKIKDVPEQVKKVADADREFYKAFETESVRSGAYPAERFSKDPNWMQHVMSRDKIYGMMTKANVRNHLEFKPLVANAIRKGREAAGLEVDDKLTDIVATAYLNRAWSQGEGGLKIKQSGDLDLADAESLKELIEEFIPEGERAGALEIIENAVVSKKPKSGDDISHMQSRLVLDKNAQVEINGHAFSMADMYENNVAKLANGYANKMSAELAFRGRGYTTKKFEKLIDELKVEAEVNANYKKQHGKWDPGKATPKDVANLQFSLDRMTHKGVRADNDTIDALFRTSGNHVYASKMGSAGLNAITESGTLIAFRGLKGFTKDLPTINSLMRSYRKGTPDSVYVAQIESLTSGAGSKLAEARASFKIQDDVATPMTGTLGKIEKITDVGKRLSNETNLLSHITDVSTRYSTAATLSRLDQWAAGSKMPRWWGPRSKAWGLSPERGQLIKDWLTGPNVQRGKGGGIIDVGLDQMDYATEKAFRQFIHRVNSNNIQKVFSGDLPRMMQTPMGAFLMKFRSFTTAAWGKHTLDDLNHMDVFAAQKLLMTAGLGMFMYMNRAYISNPFDEKKRKEALTLENALRSGATYAVNASLLPGLVDSVTEVLNGQPFIGKKRTSGLQTGLSVRNFVSNVPGVGMLDDMAKAMTIPARLMSGGDVSKEQIKAMFSVLMLDTFYGTRGIRAKAVEEAPSERSADSNKFDLLEDLKDLF